MSKVCVCVCVYVQLCACECWCLERSEGAFGSSWTIVKEICDHVSLWILEIKLVFTQGQLAFLITKPFFQSQFNFLAIIDVIYLPVFTFIISNVCFLVGWLVFILRRPSYLVLQLKMSGNKISLLLLDSKMPLIYFPSTLKSHLHSVWKLNHFLMFCEGFKLCLTWAE